MTEQFPVKPYYLHCNNCEEETRQVVDLNPSLVYDIKAIGALRIACTPHYHDIQEAALGKPK